ncbi:uncharacterized protein LOC112692590 [Sipha flava]|uniref:Uncharacterized protein LOC112692590 n=1 Tax=Sipha flava TaxID=143950 RepID=A0A8B8GJI7_9HEMI|nr:uncharacterized protein LOC112692590 [Sipha flava]
MPLTWPNCNPKKKLDFDKYLKNSSQNNQIPDDYQTTTVIHTLSSPFKVTSVINNATSSTPQQSNDNTEILGKLNRNILNIKYDMKSLNEKIDKLEDLIHLYALMKITITMIKIHFNILSTTINL